MASIATLDFESCSKYASRMPSAICHTPYQGGLRLQIPKLRNKICHPVLPSFPSTCFPNYNQRIENPLVNVHLLLRAKCLAVVVPSPVVVAIVKLV